MTLLASDVPSGLDEVDLRIVETTDLHMHLFPYDYYAARRSATLGLARAAGLVKQLRAATPNLLLFDNGDFLQGSPLGDYAASVRGLGHGDLHPAIAAMNRMGYDAVTVGNHEFNYGLDFLRRVIAGAQFPYATSNVFMAAADRATAPSFIPPFVILERDLIDAAGTRRHLRIGAIGFVPPQIMQWDRSNLEGRVFAIDIVEAARRYVPQLRAAGADVVVAMVHSGLSAAPARGMDENAAAYLAAVPGIDAILADAAGFGVDPEAIGVVGYSHGGAAAGQALIEDVRVGAAVNLDGWVRGTAIAEGAPRPYLGLFAAMNRLQVPEALWPQRYWAIRFLDVELPALRRIERGGNATIRILTGMGHPDFSDQRATVPRWLLWRPWRMSVRGTTEIRTTLNGLVISFLLRHVGAAGRPRVPGPPMVDGGQSLAEAYGEGGSDG